MNNHLAGQTSPYLLQHVQHPVDWYPWGKEALALARQRNVPLLISIGYSSCHWCHVMAHESFENEDIAAYMNSRFVCVKVDREEHPEVDAFYMDALQSMTQQGGWPLNIFALPDGTPFYGGTYFPPKSYYQRPGWSAVLEAVADAWEQHPEDIRQQGRQLLEHLKQIALAETGNGISEGAVDFNRILDNIDIHADKVWGGYMQAPKFLGTFIIRYALNFGNAEAVTQALLSLHRMLDGGIYDQIEGGISRYATDREWLIPHFEKMLYDNALFLSAVADAYRLHEDRQCGDAIDRLVGYWEKNMKAGPFYYSAMDADADGEEGAYYILSPEDLAHLDLPLCVMDFWGLNQPPCWEKKYIIRNARPEREILQQYALEPEGWRAVLDAAREQVRSFRYSHKHLPGIDTKILMGWNALMASGLIAAGKATGNKDYFQRAHELLDNICKVFVSKADDIIYNVYDGQQARILACVDDVSYLADALLHYASACGDLRYAAEAEWLVSYIIRHFSSDHTPFFFYTSDRVTHIPVRKISNYDGVQASGNSTLAGILVKLSFIYDRSAWSTRATEMLQQMKPLLERYPVSYMNWGFAAQLLSEKGREVYFNGPDKAEALRHLYKMKENVVYYTRLLPEEKAFPMESSRPGEAVNQFWVCGNGICMPPVKTVADILKNNF